MPGRDYVVVQEGEREHAIVFRRRDKQRDGFLGLRSWAASLKNVPHGHFAERLVRARGCRTYFASLPRKVTDVARR
jgi:hypothetical protein